MLRMPLAVVLVFLVAAHTNGLRAEAPVDLQQRLTETATDLSPADIAAIRATSDRWMAAVRAGRWAEAAGTFTDDATLWFAGTPYVGRAAIRRFHETMPPFDPTRVLHIDEIRGRGDMAFVAGHSTTIPVGGGAPFVVGRYLDIRLRQPDGTWLFYRDMVAPVAPQAPTQAVEPEQVINGFFELMIEVFGDRGQHARSAIGVASLPWNLAVEVEMIVQVRK